MSFSVSASSWESDVNVSNNTSVAHVKVTITTSGESFSNYDHYGTIVIDGTSYSHGAYRLPKKTTKTFESVKTITHNNDGTKSINWSYSFPVKTDDTRTGSGSLTLTTIPRATTPVVSPTSIDLGSSVTISMNRATSSFTHTLTYSIGSLSGTIGSNLGTSVTWKPPDGSTQALSPSLATAFPNAQSGTVTITCKTYNGGTLIGTKTCNLTVKTINNSNYQPSINLTINGSNLFKTKYLNKVSGVNVTSTRSGKFGATINSYSISGANTSIANNNLVISPINITMNATSQKVRFTGSVTDSRGYTGSSYKEIDLYRYNTPTLDSNYISVVRCDSAGNEITNGTYAKVNLKYTYQNDGYSNTMSVHKININGTDYTITTTETTSSGVVTGTGTQVVGNGNLGINNHYSWTITCQDEVGSIVSTNGVLQTASRIINVRPGGKGIAFGKFAETDNLVDSAWKIKSINGFEGNASSATNTNVTNTNPDSGTWYYPTFVSGTSGNQAHRVNNGFRNHLKKGTTSVVGESYLSIGNATASGKANNEKGYIQLYGQNTGRSQIEYANSTSNVTHILPDKSGKIPVYTSLYDNATGTTGNVTLSETCANFDFIEIFYKRLNTDMCLYTCVYSPNNKQPILYCVFSGTNGFALGVNTETIKISATTISRNVNSRRLNYSLNIPTSGSPTVSVSPTHDANFAIYKVVGWK